MTQSPAVRAGASERGRSLGLDIARSIAVTMVVFSHMLLDLAKTPLVTSALVYLGQTGVELFFSLSGFLIGGLIIDLAERGPTPSRVAAFWFRRWMRTLPLYFAVLWFETWHTGHPEPHAWLFLQNFYPNEPKLVTVAWSLVLEEYFYFFFPLLMMAGAVLVGGGIRSVAAVAVAQIGICTAIRFANAFHFLHFTENQVLENPFLSMDCAAYGVLAVCIYRMGRSEVAGFMARRWRGLLLACVFTYVLWGVTFVTILNFWDWADQYGLRDWGPPWFALHHSMPELVFAVLVLMLFLAKPGRGDWGWLGWGIRQCSVLSYSIYLVHLLVIVWVGAHVSWPPGLHRMGLQLALTVGISIATYLVIERPFLALRDAVSRHPLVARPARIRT